MPISCPMPLAPRQTELVIDDDRYQSNGFFADLITLFKAGSARKRRSQKLLKMHRRAAEELTADAIAQPRNLLSAEAGQRAAFEAPPLEARWGRGLDLADLVVHEAFESGRWANDLLRPAAEARQDQKFEALIRLHGKAVMSAREVLVLLRSGYSSGGFARWRTLHEVWVVFVLLADADAELSRRYLAHDGVESLKGQEDYEQTWEALGLEPPDWTAAERDKTRAELADEFGRTFLRDYGWAAPLFDNTAPKFKQLQERVKLDHWRGYYRMASHGTHANPKGITWNIQDLATTDVVWAGPSNAGLVDPAQCSLIALTNITVGLIAYAVDELPDSGDHGTLVDQGLALVLLHKLPILMDHAIKTLAEVHTQQEAEEETMADLINQATEVLQEGASITVKDLSSQLDVDLEALAEALDIAVSRGALLQETYYRMEVAGSATGGRAPAESPSASRREDSGDA